MSRNHTYTHIQGVQELLEDKLRDNRGHLKDSGLHSNPWSEAFFWGSSDDTKEKKDWS